MRKIKILIIVLSIIAVIFLIALLISNIKEKNIQNTDYIAETIKPEERYTKQKKKYDCNEFAFVSVNTEDLISIYFNNYKNYMVNNIEKAYNILNKEYKNKRFESFEEYKTYISNNYSQLSSATLVSYQIDNTNDDYTRYICMDNNGNYYIFNEKSIMNFDLILDTYTIDIPESVEKYEASNTQQKVALNIDKFIKAINARDYKYAYNCLADSFKNNYFKTQAEFETYVKNNFYEINEASYNNFETQGNLYIYSVTIKDSKGDSTKQKTFIVELRDGTDFVLSFEV